MSLKPALQSILLKTSSAADLKYSGRELTITGANRAINVDRIVSIKQEKYRAEVVQVVEAGLGSYTPTASTKYTILLGDVNRVMQGGHEVLLPYSYTTPSDLTLIGANAPAQREYIHGRIISAINANLNNYVTAATLTGGAGFTITDESGYYPVHGQNQSNRLGATTVIPAMNNDGSGFGSASVAVTTAAVYSFGVGEELLAQKPVMYNMAGNLATGVFTAPRTANGEYAVSGQNYDGFRIETLELQSAHNVTGQWALVPYETIVYVDNGTGGNPANLAGFEAFERAFHALVIKYFSASPSTFATLFSSPAAFSSVKVALTGVPTVNGVPSGATGDINAIQNDEATLSYSILGAGQTKIVPTFTNTGLQLDLDAADNEGAEYSAPLETNCPKEFVVGKQAFSLVTKLSIADVSDTDDCAFGFRKKEAYQANIDDYNDMACLNVISGDIKIETILNNAITTTTDTTENWADTETHTLEVYVDVNGAVTYKIDGYAPATTAAFSFTAGTVLVPFGYVLNAAASAPTVVVSEFAALPSNDWRI